MKHQVTALRSLSPHHRIDSLTLCEVSTDGYSLEGEVLDVCGENISILLPTPLFARLPSTPVAIRMLDGSWPRISGHVKCQQQIGVGEVLIVIQVTHSSMAVPNMPRGGHGPSIAPQFNRVFHAYPAKPRLLDWIRSWTGYPFVHAREQRLIPRLPIRTTCFVFTKNTIIQGVTRDLSFTGFSVQFSDFSPECLWNALFQIKFVKLKARPIGILHQGTSTVVRFQVESIHEGENRWRDLHYSFWQHLS